MTTNLATRPFLVVVGSGMDDMGELIKSEVVDVIDFSLHEICVRQEYGNYKKCYTNIGV